jgi:hypothetical protein
MSVLRILSSNAVWTCRQTSSVPVLSDSLSKGLEFLLARKANDLERGVSLSIGPAGGHG